MEFNGISFEDYIPGLSKSEEVYFGLDSPLSKVLLNCAKDLKDYVGDDVTKNEKNYKNKAWIKELFTISDKYADKIAKELNVEKIHFCLCASDDNLAFAESMYYSGNYITKKGDKIFINYDKIAESEDIIIVPNVGYRYRNAKGKIINICLSTGCIQKITVEQLAGSLAHELGHCFQQGIFGLYKNIADVAVTLEVKDIQRRVITLAESENTLVKTLVKIPAFKRLFKYIVIYNLDPDIDKGLKASIKKNTLKLLFRNQLSDPSYRMKDKITEFDKGENKDLLEDPGNTAIGNVLINNLNASDSSDTKDKAGKELKKDMKDTFNYYEQYNDDDIIKKKTKNWIVNFFRSIFADLKYMKINRRNVLSLTNYSTNQFQKISFYKKYEFFADIFATSYGFGPHIYRDYITEELRNLDFLNKINVVGINHLPALRALFKYSSYKAIRNAMAADVHGTNTERGRAIYTALTKELENNMDLSESQIKAIKNDIALLQASDEFYINERKDNGGFWFNLYNKLVSESINNIDTRTDELILKPIKNICEESIKKDNLK